MDRGLGTIGANLGDRDALSNSSIITKIGGHVLQTEYRMQPSNKEIPACLPGFSVPVR